MDNLFKVTDTKESVWNGGVTREYFIYPVDSTYKDRNFKIRVSEADVNITGSNFTHLPGYYRYLVPITNALILNVNGTKVPIKKMSAFHFSGSDEITSFSTGSDFNLMLADGVTGKLEIVKFYKDLIIQDDIKKNKILFFYSHENKLTIISSKDKVEIEPGELGVYISNQKFELKIRGDKDNNSFIWGKVTL